MDKRITSYIEEHGYEDQDILFADGFEDAFVGVVESFGAAPGIRWRTYTSVY